MISRRFDFFQTPVLMKVLLLLQCVFGVIPHGVDYLSIPFSVFSHGQKSKCGHTLIVFNYLDFFLHLKARN